MMKNRFFPGLILLAVLAISACAPTAAAPNAPTGTFTPVAPAPTNTPFPPVESGTTPIPPTTTVEVLPVATSRGPNLEAADPTTVSLNSGGLQLVEFFRFT